MKSSINNGNMNQSKEVKATIMLDLIEIIVYKSNHINNGSIIVRNDNRLLV